MQRTTRAFTLIELLAVIGIIGLLVGLTLPALSRARSQGRTVTCLTHLRELGTGWQMYADENDNVLLPGRMYEKPEGKRNPDNWYDVGNGLKYRPRWAALLGPYVGVFAFNEPLTEDKDDILSDLQDYDNELYQCPSEPTWNNERNHGYGYNQQFLGNAWQTNDRFHNFPVLRHRIKAPGGTVLMGDSLGTAAGFGKYNRGGYDRLSDEYQNRGNHGWSLDPPRLTDECDRGTGEPDSPRTAVDPRHQEKANVVFADGHGATMKPYDLGYRTNISGRFVDYDPSEEGDGGVVGDGDSSRDMGNPGSDGDPEAANVRNFDYDLDEDDVIDGSHNRMFSGTGRDDDPPEIPEEKSGT